MSVEEAETPQYVVTAPGDENPDDDDDKSSSVSTATTKSISSAINVSTTNRTQNIRSQSFQSTSVSSTTFDQHSSSSTSISSASLTQQLKAHSSMNIVSEKHVQRFSSSQTTMSSSSMAGSGGGSGGVGVAGITGPSKGRFMSFLQQPDTTSPTSHGSTYLTAQQKHVRQFVRSTSAHSSTESPVGSGTPGKAEKCVRSSSQQIDDEPNSFAESGKGLQQQSAAILISKSAETFEGIRASSSSASSRTQLTLSGGFLAPPNRKLTILSPIHAPPGLHELLRKHRSPLSPRISFPGADAELFP